MNLKEFKKSDTLVTVCVDSESIKNFNHINNCFYSVAKQNKKIDLLILYRNLTDLEVSQLESIAKNPVLTTARKDENGNFVEDKKELEEGYMLNFYVDKTSSDNFPKIFNEGFNISIENGYEFYSIIEPEDSVSINWFDYANKYLEEEPNLSATLPLMRNVINGAFNGLINEACWVEGFAEEAGITDINLLLRYNVINILGAVFRIKPLQENSETRDGLVFPMKESIKLTHSYEFFLRMIYNDLKIKTIPRICYELNFIAKPNYSETSSKVPSNITSLDKSLGGFSQSELQFYLDTAKKEYFFDKDRKLTFNP